MKNSRSFMLSFLAFLLIFTPACRHFTKGDTPAAPPNPGTAITFSKIHSTTVTVSWGAATDSATTAASLMYKLVRSASNNLDSVADAETNGTLVMDWTANTLVYPVTGLSATTPYYFAVLVKDDDGNKALYTQQSTTTATPGWTWMSGSNTRTQAGTYGTKGTAAAANVPGARQYAVTWSDGSGNLWLFGGIGYDSVGSGGNLNDLWKFDGTS